MSVTVTQQRRLGNQITDRSPLITSSRKRQIQELKTKIIIKAGTCNLVMVTGVWLVCHINHCFISHHKYCNSGVWLVCHINHCFISHHEYCNSGVWLVCHINHCFIPQPLVMNIVTQASGWYVILTTVSFLTINIVTQVSGWYVILTTVSFLTMNIVTRASGWYVILTTVSLLNPLS